MGFLRNYLYVSVFILSWAPSSMDNVFWFNTPSISAVFLILILSEFIFPLIFPPTLAFFDFILPLILELEWVSISSDLISPLILASIIILSFSTISPSIDTSDSNVGKTLAEEDILLKEKLFNEIENDNDVKKILNYFPGSKIFSIENNKKDNDSLNQVDDLKKEEI